MVVKGSWGKNHALASALRLRQMRHAIFLAVARDTEIQVRIGQLSSAADGAFVKGLGFGP